VNVDQRVAVGVAKDFLFQKRGAGVRVAQRRALIHFEMQLDEQAAVIKVRR